MTPLARALRKVFGQSTGRSDDTRFAAEAARGWVDPVREPPADMIRCDGPHFLRRQDDIVWPAQSPIHDLAWPEICRRLHNSASAGMALEGAAQHLVDWQLTSGGQRVLITGPGRGVGRTATLLALARSILETTESAVLLVDATTDPARNSLEERDLSIEPATPDEENSPAMVTLVPGRLWMASLARLGKANGAEREGTDTLVPVGGPLLVLIDGGSWEELDRSTWLRPGVLDGIAEIRRYDDSTVDPQFEQLRLAAGIPVVGVIETLAPAMPC